MAKVTMRCACDPGFRLDTTDNRTCLATGRESLRIDINLKRGASLDTTAITVISKLSSLSPALEGCRLLIFPTANLSIVCQADKNVSTMLRLDAAKRGRNQNFFNSREFENITVSLFPMLDLLNLTMFTPAPPTRPVEKSEIALVCLAQGSPELKFSWHKVKVHRLLRFIDLLFTEYVFPLRMDWNLIPIEIGECG
jgi:hypothetical protein